MKCSPGFSQDLDAPKYEKPDEKKKHSAVGIYIGGNNSFNYYSKAGTIASRYDLSFLFGVYGRFDISRKWQLELGMGAKPEGGKLYKFGDYYTKHDTDFYAEDNFQSATYLTVPLLLKYKLPDKSLIMFGVRWSYITEGVQQITNWYVVNGIRHEQSAFPDAMQGINRMDIGAILGYEYQINDLFSVAANLNIGFIPIYSSRWQGRWLSTVQNAYIDPVQLGNYNNSLSISFCYNFWRY